MLVKVMLIPIIDQSQYFCGLTQYKLFSQSHNHKVQLREVRYHCTTGTQNFRALVSFWHVGEEKMEKVLLLLNYFCPKMFNTHYWVLPGTSVTLWETQGQGTGIGRNDYSADQCLLSFEDPLQVQSKW